MVPTRLSGGSGSIGEMRSFVLVARRDSDTNRRLLEAAGRLGFGARRVDPEAAARVVVPGDVALCRLDVLETLDGPEPGLELLRELERYGVTVLNRSGALVGAHDKLVTALRLAANGLPHPRTAHVGDAVPLDFEFPVVVKPRYGSWGADVVRCSSQSALRRTLRALRLRPWFRHQGALVQELVPGGGRDLRILVAGGRAIGAIERVAAPGEWRTNVALGGERRAIDAPPAAAYLAVRAAASIGADLVGVDVLPDGGGGWIVLELNGAVDFTHEYGFGGADVFRHAVDALVGHRARPASPLSEKLACG